MLTVLEDGGMVEIASVGREGILGVSAVWDGILPSLKNRRSEPALHFHGQRA